MIGSMRREPCGGTTPDIYSPDDSALLYSREESYEGSALSSCHVQRHAGHLSSPSGMTARH